LQFELNRLATHISIIFRETNPTFSMGNSRITTIVKSLMKVEMLYPIPRSDGFDVFDGPIQDDGFVCQNKL